MTSLESTGKFLILVGVIIILAGAFLVFFKHVPFLGKLPGDILVQKKNFTLYFPLATSIVVSIVITFILYLLGRK